MIALILAAGYATRLYPLTINTPKPLLPVGPKAMIDYITDEIETIPDVNKIVVVTNHRFADHFAVWAKDRSEKDLSDGKILTPIEVIDDGTTDDSNKLGAIGDIQFVIDKLAIDEDMMIIAGDNLFTYKLKDMYNFFMSNRKDTLISVTVEDIEQLKKLAVATIDENGKVVTLEEKPKEPKSNYAVTGLYFYPKGVSERAHQVVPSARGELEITTLNEMYLQDGALDVQLLGRGFAWLDTGTMDSLVEAANFIKMIAERQGITVSAPEEIAYKNGWISKEKLIESANCYGKSPYGAHLKAVAEGKVRY